jgi:hypothetical protein
VCLLTHRHAASMRSPQSPLKNGFCYSSVFLLFSLIITVRSLVISPLKSYVVLILSRPARSAARVLLPANVMFEHRSTPLLPPHKFLMRLARTALFGLLIMIASLFIGMCGYHYFEGLSWIDAFANAAMILSGMGPLSSLTTYDGKLFAGIYALFSGLTFITVAGVILSPIVHRVFHRFLIESEEEE